MQDFPLLISSLIEDATLYHGDVEIVSRTIEGPVHRTNYRELNRRAKQLERDLEDLEREPGRGSPVAAPAYTSLRRGGRALCEQVVAEVIAAQTG